MMVVLEEDILMVAKIIKVVGIMNSTSLEWQTLPALLMVELTVLMRFGWLIVANIIPGVALPMLMALVSMVLPFWLVPATIFLPLIHSATIVPLTIMAVELLHTL